MIAAKFNAGVAINCIVVNAGDTLPEGYVLVPDHIGIGMSVNTPAPPTDLTFARATKNAELVAAYRAAIQQPVVYMGATFQADEDSQDVLNKALASGTLPAGFAWLDINNVWVPMTHTQLQGLAGAMLAQGFAAFQKLQGLKKDLRNTTTVDQINAITW